MGNYFNELRHEVMYGNQLIFMQSFYRSVRDKVHYCHVSTIFPVSGI